MLEGQAVHVPPGAGLPYVLAGQAHWFATLLPAAAVHIGHHRAAAVCNGHHAGYPVAGGAGSPAALAARVAVSRWRPRAPSHHS